MVTTLKNTALPVTALDFPTVTICASGFYMDNVAKAVKDNFAKWREAENRTDGDNVLQDMLIYMKAKFQIETREDNATNPVNILDILDTMVASNLEASVAANGVRENVLACKETTSTPAAVRKKREVECCKEMFVLINVQSIIPDVSEDIKTEHLDFHGFYELSSSKANHLYYKKKDKMRWLSVSNDCPEGKDCNITFVSKCRPDSSYGCLDDDNDASIMKVDFFKGFTNYPSDLDFCEMSKPGPDWISYNEWFGGEKEKDFNTLSKNITSKFDVNASPPLMNIVCSEGPTTQKTTTATTATTATSATTASSEQQADEAVRAAVNQVLTKRACIKTSSDATNTPQDNGPSLPGVDIFLNPAKTDQIAEIVSVKQGSAKRYFQDSDMSLLYPELFRILWESSLPCVQEEARDHMLTSCQIAGRKINCSEIFTRVPTDSGMCCALNAAEALRQSQYQELVEDMQQTRAVRKIKAQVGKKNGLKLTLDLHSNLVSFGTLDQDVDAFNMFIGRPAEFPVMRERSLPVEPGHEHWVDLSASVVSSSDGVRDIDSRARNCYFSDEGSLTFYQEYTFTNCRLECGILDVEKQLGCIPWFLPQVKRHQVLRIFLNCLQGSNSVSCDPWTAREFSSLLGEVQAASSACQHCLPDCQLTAYTQRASRVKFRSATFDRAQIVPPLSPL